MEVLRNEEGVFDFYQPEVSVNTFSRSDITKNAHTKRSLKLKNQP